MKIDVTFDFQAEAGKRRNGEERDSDKYSPTLQEYHRLLWSKPLPNGKMFELTKTSSNRLYHKSEVGEYILSSDWGAVTLSGRQGIKRYLGEIDPSIIENFQKLVITIGARIIWPSNRIDGKTTINGAKGMNYLISDRLDLTIECIRRYYLNEQSPLHYTLKSYSYFFDLFDDFKGYIDFFLFQDYVSDDYKTVHIAQPYDNFISSPVPGNVSEYLEYFHATSALIRARNSRITEATEGSDEAYKSNIKKDDRRNA